MCRLRDGDSMGRAVNTRIPQPSNDGDTVVDKTTKAPYETTITATNPASGVVASKAAVHTSTRAPYQTTTTTKTQTTATKMNAADLLMMAITRLEEMEEKMKGMEEPTNA